MQTVIGIIGLGYVGLPLAVAFSKKYKVFGLDSNYDRIEKLKEFEDKTNEINSIELKKSFKNGLQISSNISNLVSCNVFIITVPTPIKKDKKPNLSLIIKATENLTSVIDKGDIIVYESTVYPGVTEEVCVPIIEEKTKLIINKDFFIGYSPERINPGDKKRTLSMIKKVVAGSNKSTLKVLSSLYNSIIKAGVYEAPSIKVAEAAKVIENTQRDINIAFINELAIIFNKLGIDTHEVLKAAGTKWNFLKFYPGLVGGHCIGIDPYYLAFKAKELGYSPKMILAGRETNDYMPIFIINEIVKIISKKNVDFKNVKSLILGATFKENCPDIRNSKVLNIYEELIDFGVSIDVFDPLADKIDFKKTFGISLKESLNDERYDFIILAVSHDQFLDINPKEFLKKNGFVYDIKGFYNDASFIRL
ncbi:MAG: nucleotide sugar dehydrogenase [Flavobacteriaceae bacterium]|nr:nucleotide sugar dehydrogenase [Flavobacteriaceae bacterium]